MKGLFVTGTDTSVGKTVVACALAALWTRAGRTISVMKPFETGDGDDAQRLARATGRELDPELVCPYRFPMPASPEVAARWAGVPLDLERITKSYQQLCRDADGILVEGAGGLLVPIGKGKTMADLAATLRLPLLIVARPSLGTVNHTLLTLEAARHRRLPVAGVIFSRRKPRRGPDEPHNPEAIVRYGEVRLYGALPRLPEQALADPATLAARTAKHLRSENLWKAL